jgi:hypothetical protein
MKTRLGLFHNCPRRPHILFQKPSSTDNLRNGFGGLLLLGSMKTPVGLFHDHDVAFAAVRTHLIQKVDNNIVM